MELCNALIADKMCPLTAPPRPNGLINQNSHNDMLPRTAFRTSGRTVLASTPMVTAVVTLGATLKR